MLVIFLTNFFPLKQILLVAIPDGVDGVRHEAGSDGDAPAEDEGEEHVGVISQQDGLQGVVEAKVHSTVDEDAYARDDKASVQTLDAVRLQRLPVDVDQAVELALAALWWLIQSHLVYRLTQVFKPTATALER